MIFFVNSQVQRTEKISIYFHILVCCILTKAMKQSNEILDFIHQSSVRITSIAHIVYLIFNFKNNAFIIADPVYMPAKFINFTILLSYYHFISTNNETVTLFFYVVSFTDFPEQVIKF